MRILALGHEKRTGKDTAAKLAVSYLKSLGVNARKAGFADKLKQQCHELYSWAGLQPGGYYDIDDNAHLRNIVLPKIGLTPRELWIGHGQANRTVYDAVYIDYLLNTVSCDFLIISDLRFPLEVEHIRAAGGKICKIERPSIARTSDEADDALLGFTDWDYTIVNDGLLLKLNYEICAICDKERK